MTSALYVGDLLHARAVPVRHRFAHSVYMLALDVDELPELGRRVRLFGYNRARPVTLCDRDYHGAEGVGVAAAVRAFLRERGAPHDGRIVLVTHARVFGYVFNPVSFFYCLDDRGRLTSVVAEVNNTFGDGHRYFLPGGDGEADKLLHVSPFLDMRCRYRFRFLGVPDGGPGDPLEVRMDVHRRGEPVLVARLSLRRRALTDAALLAALARYPLIPLQVTARIHWEAFRLWIKGAPFVHAPPHDPEAARRMHDREALGGPHRAPHDAGVARARRHGVDIDAREARGAADPVAVAQGPPDPGAS